MYAEETIIEKVITVSKIKDYALLLKLRLAALVVLSAIAGFFFAGGIVSINFVYLILGGFLITGSSNGLNQIIERDLDKKMDRTANRPIPSGRMSVTEALIISIVTGVVGSLLLFQLNYFSGVLGYLFIIVFVVTGAALAFNAEFFTSNVPTLDQLTKWFPLLLLK